MSIFCYVGVHNDTIISNSSVPDDVSDSDFDINNSSISCYSSNDDSLSDEDQQQDKPNCFLVYRSQLERLFKFCLNCGTPVDRSLMKETASNGSNLCIEINCSKTCSVKWQSQPATKFIRGQGNIDITAGLTFAGIPPAKFEQFAWIIKLKHFHSSTFYRLRNQFIAPVIRSTWNEENKKVFFFVLFFLRNFSFAKLIPSKCTSYYYFQVINQLKEESDVTLLGDGRSDSPGHSAKYGTYTLMDEKTGKIVDTTVVSVTDVISNTFNNFTFVIEDLLLCCVAGGSGLNSLSAHVCQSIQCIIMKFSSVGM